MHQAFFGADYPLDSGRAMADPIGDSGCQPDWDNLVKQETSRQAAGVDPTR
jgi:hypothetical protein